MALATLRTAPLVSGFIVTIMILLATAFQGALAVAPATSTAAAVETAAAAGTTTVRVPMNGTQYRTTALACSKSTLAGFAKKVTLKPKLLFHWKIVGSTLYGAIVAQAGGGAKNGWISVAWTQSPGQMYPADAVVGNLPAPTRVKAYAMNGYSMSSVVPSSAFKVTATSVTSSTSATIIKFTRSGKTGLSPIKYAGTNNIIWAYSYSGSSKAFGDHGPNWGSASVNLACNV
ncbi:hypothetical protein CLOM_g11565 [Closterium sp. NIES-68]|nr:hypothetical protein CLOM_g11565 [Closterium sp. NIES-68]GJP64934.1 hypothetical protein CLOP_g21869 [Closterium sp. NIES-67]